MNRFWRGIATFVLGGALGTHKRLPTGDDREQRS
jgi:hypothetical protein